MFTSIAMLVVTANVARAQKPAPTPPSTTPATPQKPASTTPAPVATVPAHDTIVDSLSARLARAEQAIDELRRQAAESDAGAAHAASGIHMELTGRIIVNAFSNNTAVNNVDNPQLVRPDTGANAPARGGSASPRQSRVGFRVTDADVLGGSFLGDIDLDFYGGQEPSPGGRTFPLMRIRTTRMEIAWSHADVMIGQETPLFSDLNPVSLAAIGAPLYSTSGNLWLWIPQFRIGLTAPGPVRFGVQGAVLAPNSSDPQPVFSTQNDVAERSGRPMLEARVHMAWGDELSGGDIGCAVHQNWWRFPAGLTGTSGYGCDAHVPIGWFELRGEAFMGRGLRSLGGGAIGNLLGTEGSSYGGGSGSGSGSDEYPVFTRGGWAQLNISPVSAFMLSLSCGADDPNDDQLTAAAPNRNVACAAGTQWRPAGPAFVGAEVRRMTTTYGQWGALSNTHINLAFGFDL